MKTNKSPAHKTLQIRRKTQKIVIPRAYWDLSNKENDNLNNFQDQNKSKNTSSKKSSLQKKKKLFTKKTHSMTQNMLKKIVKKGPEDTSKIKDKKEHNLSKEKRQIVRQISEIKKYNSHQQEVKSCPMNRKMIQDFNILYKEIQKQQNSEKIKEKYNKLFLSSSSNLKERKMLENVEKHLTYWIDECKKLKQTLKVLELVTPKLHVENIVSEGQLDIRSMSNQLEESQDSICSYLADPKIKVSVKSIRPDLKEKLHLNFSKVEEFRKKELG